MTTATEAGTTGRVAHPGSIRHRVKPHEAASVAVLLTLAAVLFLWQLGASGWANSFYTAAAQAGSKSWKALLFGASDAAGAITVDKTPGFLWIIGLSVRVFGLNAWSILVPQALEGVAAVGILYAAVRRTSGHGAGLIAGAALALTPVAVLMFRFNNPDALLVLLLVAAAYCLIRSVERASIGWLVTAGAAIGFAFLAKELQAFVVLPVFVAVYLVAAPAALRRRLAHLFAAAAAVVVSAGWYLALVEFWPADSRPYIGGSQHNDILELTLGYNGFGRLTGDEAGGLGNTDAEAGWGRLFDTAMGGQIAWLLPAAAVMALAALWALRRFPRTDRRRAALLLWGGWLLVAGLLLSFAAGIVHPYYTVQLAPAIAGVIGTAAPVLWRLRERLWARVALAAAILVTAVLAGILLLRTPHWHAWLPPVLIVGGTLVSGALVLSPLLTAWLRSYGAPEATGTVVTSTLAATALLGMFASPAAYSIATASAPHHGSIPTAGPTDPHTASLPFGGTGSGHHHSTLLDAEPAGPRLVAMLKADAEQYSWSAATVGSNAAAGFQLSSGLPVMAIGGFNGTDPFPTLDGFRRLVAEGRIHYFVAPSSDLGGVFGMIDPLVRIPGLAGRPTAVPDPPRTPAPPSGPDDMIAPWIPLPPGHSAHSRHRAGGAGPGSSLPTRITDWVIRNYRGTRVDGETVYDLSAPAQHRAARPAVTTHRNVP